MKGFALLLTGVVLVLSVTAWAGTPEGVSPGADEVAVVGSTCPTFSWSEVDGAEGYTIEVYEVTGNVKSHDDLAYTSKPVISKNAGMALSWTPSGSECLKDGLRYVWFVGARKVELGTLNVERIWSEGRVFEVSLLSDAETVEAARELVNSYLQTDWLKTESFTTVKEEIKREITGNGNITAEGKIGIMGNEGDSNLNTYYGTGTDNSLPGTAYYNAFFGYNAGYSNTGGDNNTFIGIRQATT